MAIYTNMSEIISHLNVTSHYWQMATTNEGRKFFLPLILVFHRNGAVIVLLLFTKQQLR